MRDFSLDMYLFGIEKLTSFSSFHLYKRLLTIKHYELTFGHWDLKNLT